MKSTPPIASQDETLRAILDESGRPDKVPLRDGFVQGGERGKPHPGPLAEIVSRGRSRALDQYLLAVAWASAAPWDVRKDSRIWARALGMSSEASGRSAVSRNWTFLANLKLIEVERSQRLARVTLLREDGSGRPYRAHPAGDRSPRYLTLPFAYWTEGYSTSLSLPAKAILLIARHLTDGFTLPAERAHDWYGISETTARAGLRELREKDLLSARKQQRKAPLAPNGYTTVNYYTLRKPFGPKSAEKRRSTPAQAVPAKATLSKTARRSKPTKRTTTPTKTKPTQTKGTR